MKPKLYSREDIGWLAFLLSPFLASILFVYNLKEIGKGRIGPLFILGSLGLNIVIQKITPGLNVFFQLAIANLIGSLMLAFSFWDKYFKDYDYERKSVAKPVLIFTGVFVVLFIAIFIGQQINGK